MKNNSENTQPKGKKRQLTRIEKALCWAAAVLLLILLTMALLVPYIVPPVWDGEPTAPSTTTAPQETQQTEAPIIEEPTTEETTIPVETEPQMLPEMAELYGQNPDIAGWIVIEGTPVNYPVMYSPEDNYKYLYANFEGKWNANGLPYIEKNCSIDPESDNLVIYGHNMTNGAMFATLMDYADKDFWESHPVVKYKTLYEEREYEIIAAFEDRVYYKYEDVFKFYQFIDAEDEAHYQEAITYYKEHALYDTGVDAQYGDHLLTLVTCAYHVEDGRFVVVAREITDEN